MVHNLINLDKWNALTPTYQAIVRNCSEMANT
jgi:TRAP-type mannitol/chloroaromatic compound transport system substrate-binding protein